MLIKPFLAMAGDTIYKRGEIGRELYMIIDGKISIVFEDTADDAAVLQEAQQQQQQQQQKEAAAQTEGQGTTIGRTKTKQRGKHVQHLEYGGVFGEGCIVELFKIRAAKESGEDMSQTDSYGLGAKCTFRANLLALP